MSLINASQSILKQMKMLLVQLSDEQYLEMLEVFSGATIGQHTRHILEFYECVLLCSDSDSINYDLRKRNLLVEQNTKVALGVIDRLLECLENEISDRPIIVEGELGGSMNLVQSSMMRELLYAIEHAVHHMAILKIGILTSFTKIKLAAHFGVAESTIKYKEQIKQ